MQRVRETSHPDWTKIFKHVTIRHINVLGESKMNTPMKQWHQMQYKRLEEHVQQPQAR